MNRHLSAIDPSSALAADAAVDVDVEAGQDDPRTATSPVPAVPVAGMPTMAELRARIEAIERARPGRVAGSPLVRRPRLPDRRAARASGSGPPASPWGRPHTDRGDGEGGASPQAPHARALPSHLPAPLSPSQPAPRRTLPPWRLGAREIDGLLPASGLEDDALHEIKPVLPARGQAAGAAAAAAQQLALALAARRLGTVADSSDAGMARAAVLWCAPAAVAAEAGRPYGHGLAALGLDPARLLFAETATAADALWALEEGLASGSLALAIGLIDEIDLTPARRLSLAAAARRTPCLLITSARSAPTAATATRWRVGPAAGAEHPFDAGAPGAAVLEVALERCRRAPQAAAMPPVLLEWCDEAYRFRLAAGVAHREMAQSGPGRQCGRAA